MRRHTPRHAAAPKHVIPWRLIRRSLTALALAAGALTLAGAFLALPYGPGYVPPADAAPPASKTAPTTGQPSSTDGSSPPSAPSADRQPSAPAVTVIMAGAHPLRLALPPPSTQASPPERAGAPLEQSAPAPVTDEPEPAAPGEQGQGQSKLDPQPDHGQDDQHGHDDGQEGACT